jgi:hypothetical protein
MAFLKRKFNIQNYNLCMSKFLWQYFIESPVMQIILAEISLS